MTKLIVSDMDGTLLNDNGELPEQLREVVLRLRSKGIEFAIASGRQYETLKQFFGEMAQELLLIADNGSLVAHKGEIKYTVPIASAQVNEVLDLAHDMQQAYPILCTAETAYIAKAHKDIYQQVKQYYAKLELVDDLRAYTEEVIKITFCDLVDAQTNSAAVLTNLNGKLQLAVSGDRWLDLTSPGVNKGKALEWVQSELAIPVERMLVFGDHYNDVEMLQLVPNSYAMQNAHDEIKQLASNTTAFTNDQNGVIATIHALGLLDD